MIELQSRECIVRSYRPGDAASLAKHGNNRRIWENLRDRFPHPYAEAHAAQYIERLSASSDDVRGRRVDLWRVTDLRALQCSGADVMKPDDQDNACICPNS